jgi:transposase
LTVPCGGYHTADRDRLASALTREGLTGLADRPRPGRAQTVRRARHAEILATTLIPPPQVLGVTHWSRLFAALEVATGHVTDATAPRHRHTEFLAFLQQVAKTYPRRRLHVICDNYATHKHQKVQAWLLGHSRVQLHSTPTCASWLNLVEVFFSIVERQVPCRGDFASVADLAAAIGRFISA